MSNYKYRGWFWGGTGVLVAAAVIIRLIMMLTQKSGVAIGEFVYGVVVLAICVGAFIYMRRQSWEQWEDKYGVSDERAELIRGRAAVVTLKLIAIALFSVHYLVGSSDSMVFSGVRFLSGVLLAVGALTYFLLQCFFDNKM